MKRLALLLVLACSPAIAAEQLVAITASWCGPCRQFKADLADDPSLAGGREIRVLDVDEDRAEARRYRARSLPTFVLLEDGREVRRTAGYTDADTLRRWLEQ